MPDDPLGEGRVRDLAERHQGAGQGRQHGQPTRGRRGGDRCGGGRRLDDGPAAAGAGPWARAVPDLVLQLVRLGAEDGLHVVADLDHPGGARECRGVHSGLVGDLDPKPGDAGVDGAEVVRTTEGSDQLLCPRGRPLGAGGRLVDARRVVQLGVATGVRRFQRMIANRKST